MIRRVLQLLAVAVIVVAILNFLRVLQETSSVGEAFQGSIQPTGPAIILAVGYLIVSGWQSLAGVSGSLATGYTSTVRGSGPILASARTGARLGPVRLPVAKAEVR